MKRIAETLGVARSNLAVQAIAAPRRRRGRPPQPDAELLAEIKEIIAWSPSDVCTSRRPTANCGHWASRPCGIGSA